MNKIRENMTETTVNDVVRILNKKEERKKQLLNEIKRIREETKNLRYKRYSCEVELDYIHGNCNESWEEKYGKRR